MTPSFIDVVHTGVPGAIAAFHGEDWLLDPGPESTVNTLLAGLPEGFEPKRILLTHIHFDHAGATGRLLERWPGAEVWVHEIGAPHIIDPTRLVNSARRLYGEDFDRLWGEVVPIDAANVRVISGGETIDGWRVAYTPGHAKHHVCYLQQDTGVAFTGDMAGVRIADGPSLPPTPPPDIDIELWQESLAVLKSWAPAELACTHFGVYSDTAAQLTEVSENLIKLSELARHLDAEAYAAAIVAHIADYTDNEATRLSYAQANPTDTLWPGLNRYWTKKAEAQAASE